MKQQVKYEVMHLLKMANITNDDIADRIAERICLIAKEHYDPEERVVKKGKWYQKITHRWFDNESKF
jgi:Holliday junction resolvasome RuvABC endonuclease subunit